MLLHLPAAAAAIAASTRRLSSTRWARPFSTGPGSRWSAASPNVGRLYAVKHSKSPGCKASR
jgi:hypothetical protein